jgi:hypothetical protein
MDGNEGLGRNSCDRGRKAIKVSLICNLKGVTIDASIEKGNTHDSKILKSRMKAISFPKPIKCLADSGYVGKALKYLKKNLILVAKPRKKRNGLTRTYTYFR